MHIVLHIISGSMQLKLGSTRNISRTTWALINSDFRSALFCLHWARTWGRREGVQPVCKGCEILLRKEKGHLISIYIQTDTSGDKWIRNTKKIFEYFIF